VSQLSDAVQSKTRRHSVTEQRGQIVRYLTACRGYTTEAAWTFVDALQPAKLRLMYRLLRIAQEQGCIVWEAGQFVEKRLAGVVRHDD
jgi:hypothetical protein